MKPRRVMAGRHAPQPIRKQPVRPIRISTEMAKDYRALKAAGLLLEWRNRATCRAHSCRKRHIAGQQKTGSEIGQFVACAVRRHGLSVGANPARQLSLQPVAIGAGAEATKRLKPPM